MREFNRQTILRNEEGAWICEFYAKGGEGTLAPLAPYGLDDSVGFTIDEKNASVFRRLLGRGEIQVTLLKTWNGVKAF